MDSSGDGQYRSNEWCEWTVEVDETAVVLEEGRLLQVSFETLDVEGPSLGQCMYDVVVVSPTSMTQQEVRDLANLSGGLEVQEWLEAEGCPA